MLTSCSHASCRARVWVVKISSTLLQPRHYMHMSASHSSSFWRKGVWYWFGRCRRIRLAHLDPLRWKRHAMLKRRSQTMTLRKISEARRREIIWPKVVPSDGLLWTRQLALGFQKRCGISDQLQDFSSSQEGLCPMDLLRTLAPKLLCWTLLPEIRIWPVVRWCSGIDWGCHVSL
jgi:hypothetical protein